MLVVFGLGNPGAQYAATRHNLGFQVVDELVRRTRTRARRGEGDYDAARVELAGTTLLLVKPRTYVNRSGRAVAQLGSRYGFEPAELLTVVDDVWLPFGRLRLRGSGSAGGHNGLQSIIEELGTTAFPRLRLGVGSPAGQALDEYVLQDFSSEERSQLPDFVGRGADAVQEVARIGVARALSVVNKPVGDSQDPG